MRAESAQAKAFDHRRLSVHRGECGVGAAAAGALEELRLCTDFARNLNRVAAQRARAVRRLQRRAAAFEFQCNFGFGQELVLDTFAQGSF